MSGYECRNRWVFSLRRNTGNDGADVTCSGRLFQTLGPAEANERSSTVNKWPAVMDECQVGWKTLTSTDSVTACRRLDAVDPTSSEELCRRCSTMLLLLSSMYSGVKSHTLNRHVYKTRVTSTIHKWLSTWLANSRRYDCFVDMTAVMASGLFTPPYRWTRRSHRSNVYQRFVRSTQSPTHLRDIAFERSKIAIFGYPSCV